MATKVNVLGLSVVIVFMLLKTSHSQAPRCHKTLQKNSGCEFHKISSNSKWCEAASNNIPGFDFYIKPGDNFNGLNVQITRAVDFFIGKLEGTYYIEAKKDLFPMADKWYHIQFKSEKEGWLNEIMAYILFIDGRKSKQTQLRVIQASKFILLINGSPLYSASSCNPGNFPSPRLTNPPPRPPPMSLAPPPLAVATTKTNIAIPGNDLPITENSSIQPSFMRDSNNNSTDSDTPRIFGEPWWVSVIVGVAFMIIIAVIITAVIMIKRWREKKENETGGNDEEKDTSKITTNNNDWQSQAPPAQQFYESDDPANHIYEEPEDDNVEEHIYETVEDLGGPITFVNSNGGQSAPYSVAWQTRRGSSHDSENSIYGCL